jgi:hypothetical protein
MIVFFASTFFKKDILELFKKSEIDEKVEEKTEIDEGLAYIRTLDNLKEHKLFTESSFMEYKINMISLTNVKKSKLFRDLLTIKYDAIKKHSIELLNLDPTDLDSPKLYGIMLNNLTDIITEYNNNMKLKYGEDIYDLVMIHPTKGFNKIHEKSVDYIKMYIDSEVDEHFQNKTYVEKIDFLFDFYAIAIRMAINDVSVVYLNFNGDLDKLLK